LWRYKLGEVQLARGNRSAARTNLRAALDGSARDWVRARTHLALGKIADASGERTRAREHYTRAVRLAEVGRDPATRREAQRFIRQPFR
jgi:Tfp pilus assembly protein PilF